MPPNSVLHDLKHPDDDGRDDAAPGRCKAKQELGDSEVLYPAHELTCQLAFKKEMLQRFVVCSTEAAGID